MKPRAIVTLATTLAALIAACSFDPAGSAPDEEADAHVEPDGDEAGAGTPRPLIIVSIDSLNPEYLSLDASGRVGGGPGDRLMPNVAQFLESATLFADARDYLPAATDMNHLNALAGTSSAQTGIVGVSVQIVGWNADATPVTMSPHVGWAADGAGRPVDTLFDAWRRRWPASGIAIVTGKGWVGEAFREEGGPVDLIATATAHPAYVPEPVGHSLFDPPGDGDAACDPESAYQVMLGGLIAGAPEQAPPDSWVAEAALSVLDREQPDLAFVLLAQVDDLQHALGAAWNPDEFVARTPRYVPPAECPRRGQPDWQLVSRRNPHVYREAVLDGMRDADDAFGQLLQGLQSAERYRDATIVLYSDHGQITHLLGHGVVDPAGSSGDTDIIAILLEAGAITEVEAEGDGFVAGTATSIGELYFRGGSVAERDERARVARQALLAHQVENPESGAVECPWDVLTREEMRTGLSDVAAPAELWHELFGRAAGPEPIVWPDLFVFARNGWQLPVYSGMLTNLGIEVPIDVPLNLMLGGHGAADTQNIVMAFSGPPIVQGVRIDDPGHERDHRIADIAITVAPMHDLTLEGTTVGQDLSAQMSIR